MIITVTAVDKSKTYGDEDPELTYTIDPYGLDDKVIGTLSRVKGENAGTYAITQGNLTTTESGYVLNFVPAVFTIDPKPLTVAAKNAEKIYGDPDPALTYTVTTGLAEGETEADVLTGALTRVPGEDVGGYTINKGDLRLISGNYTLADDAFTPAALAINPKRSPSPSPAIGPKSPTTDSGIPPRAIRSKPTPRCTRRTTSCSIPPKPTPPPTSKRPTANPTRR
ncbi:MAG: hypothetical protein IJH86_05150 [Clostridia bacterium]|nr:hypothetical protein [Clostridia bacterium]